MSDNAAHLDRVTRRIGHAIEQFAAQWPGEFHADELRAFVVARVGSISPASPDRVLRLLRKRGRVNYEVIDRGKSLYRWRAVDRLF